MRDFTRYIKQFTMTVPRQHQLHAGVSVNIVLKADQRSGKLTKGQIANILTRGDHPRGIKVRLADGQIGRVQSLSSSVSSSSLNDVSAQQRESTPRTTASESRGNGRGRTGFVQQDVRFDGHDPAGLPPSRSLADYITFPEETRPAVDHGVDDEAINLQQELEEEFPNLDTALIAAIVADHDDIKSAKDVLKTLS